MGRFQAVVLSVALFGAMILPCGAAEKTAPAASDTKPAATVFKGKVINDKDKPIPNAKVFVLTYKRSVSTKPTHTLIYTDKQGRFSYTKKEQPGVNGPYFAVTAPGYSYSRVYPRDNSKELEITLLPEYKLKGKVVDENGKPLPDIKVEVENCWAYRNGGPSTNLSNVAGIMEARTGKDGRFVVNHLVNPEDFDQYSLQLGLSGKDRASINKNIEKNTLDDGVEVELPRACTVEGTLSLPDKAGFAAPEGTKMAVKASNEWSYRAYEAKVDKQGRFRFDNLPPGKATVLLGSPDPTFDKDGNYIAPEQPEWALPAVDQELTPDKATKLELALTPGAIIKGTVTSKSTGKPINRAYLTIEHAGAPQGIYWSIKSTDENGNFTARVAAGDVRVLVQRTDNSYYQPDEAPTVSFKISDGEEKTDIALAVEESQNSYSNSLYEAVNKPIPPDFEIKAGTYEMAWDPELEFRNSGSLSPNMSGEKLKTIIKAAPKWASKNIKLNAYRFDGSEDERLLAVVLDESQGTGKGFDTAYIDSNRNWDLTDDQPIKIKVGAQYTQNPSDWVTITSQQVSPDGQKTNHPVQARVRIYFTGTDIRPYLQKKGGWRGFVETTKGKAECVAPDSNGDGVYGDMFTWNENCDPVHYGEQIFIDTTGHGSAITMGWGSHALGLHPLNKIGNKFYSIKVNVPGSGVTVEPYTGPTGYLLVRGGDIQGAKASAESLRISSRDGSHVFEGTSGKPVEVPAGKYKLWGCSLNVESADSNKLPMSCSLGSHVEVKPGETASFDIKGKLSLALNPDERKLSWEPGQSASISWMIKIGDNITLSSIGSQRDNDAPKIKFYDKKGNLLKTTTAGYT